MRAGRPPTDRGCGALLCGPPLEESPSTAFIEHCRYEALSTSFAAGCAGQLDERALGATLDDFDFDCDEEWAWSPRWGALVGGAATDHVEPEPVDRARFGAACASDVECGDGMACDHGRTCGAEGPFYCMPRFCARPFYHLGPSHTCADECGA